MKIAIISPFTPNPSGISKFNRDLMNSLKTLDASLKLFKVAINHDNAECSYNEEIFYQIRKDTLEDYTNAAVVINSEEVDLVCIEHEFYQFGGAHGNYILDLVENMHKPIVMICHTVPLFNDSKHLEERKDFFLRVKNKVKLFITLSRTSEERLVELGISSKKIRTIIHGVPDVLEKNSNKTQLRNTLGLSPQSFLLISFGFYHPNKGTIYVIQAMEEIKKQNVDCKLIIIGTTLNTQESISYYNEIKAKITELHLEKDITLIDKFIPENLLTNYLNAVDAGITAYIHKSYTASGALSFLIGGGKLIITTPYVYANDILKESQAIFVPFKNSDAISNAIISLTKDNIKKLQLTENILKLREALLWPKVAEEYLDALKFALQS